MIKFHRMKWCELQEYKWNEYVTIAVNRNLSNCEKARKKGFRGFNGIRTRGLGVSAAVLYQPELWRPIHWRATNLLSSSTRERNETQNEMMWTAGIQMKWVCDHHSESQLSNCEKARKKDFGALTGFEPVVSALALQCSTSLSYEDPYTGGRPIYWAHQPVKGMKHRMKWCELREYKWNEYVIIAVNRNLSNCEKARKKDFGASTGFEPVVSALALQCSTSLSYEDPYTGGRPIYWAHQPVKGMKHRMKWCELREYKWNEYVTIAVNRNLSNCEKARKKGFWGFNGIRTRGLCVSAAVLYQPELCVRIIIMYDNLHCHIGLWLVKLIRCMLCVPAMLIYYQFSSFSMLRDVTHI